MLSTREVASRAGVSIATVSATINDAPAVRLETRQRVLDAIASLGYQPNGVARSLRLGGTGVIGLVVSQITNPYDPEICRLVEEAALAAGKVVVVCNTDEIRESNTIVVKALRIQRIAGLIITPAGGHEYGADLTARVPQRTVVIDKCIPSLEGDFAGLDNKAAGRMIAEYLLRLGHRRIGFVGGRSAVSTAADPQSGRA